MGSFGPVAFTRSIFKTITSELNWPAAWDRLAQALGCGGAVTLDPAPSGRQRLMLPEAGYDNRWTLQPAGVVPRRGGRPALDNAPSQHAPGQVALTVAVDGYALRSAPAGMCLLAAVRHTSRMMGIWRCPIWPPCPPRAKAGPGLSRRNWTLAGHHPFGAGAAADGQNTVHAAALAWHRARLR